MSTERKLQVTDEMVERAVVAWHGYKEWRKDYFDEGVQNMLADFRRALEAALNGN